MKQFSRCPECGNVTIYRYSGYNYRCAVEECGYAFTLYGDNARTTNRNLSNTTTKLVVNGDMTHMGEIVRQAYNVVLRDGQTYLVEAD